jgi:hypothetical protein
MESKPRVVKDYEKLETVIQEQIKLTYPYGFSEYLVSYVDREGKKGPPFHLKLTRNATW